MGPNSDDHADPEGRQATLRRRVLGLVLGGVLSAAIGWGLHGGLKWFHLLDIPIHSGPSRFPLTSVVAHGLAGIVWGLAVAWPRKWQLSRPVHQYAQAQGWQGYSLEAVRAESCHTAARVYMSGGPTRLCKASIPISYPSSRNKQPEITVTCLP